jgi:hypothetical protein
LMSSNPTNGTAALPRAARHPAQRSPAEFDHSTRAFVVLSGMERPS